MGRAAAKIAEALGTPFMPWQHQVADVTGEYDPVTLLPYYRDNILTVPRQSGKTSLLLPVILVRALGARRQQIRYTAQTGLDARKKWMDDWLPILENSKFAPLFRARKVNGHEALLFKNGSQQGLVATTKKTGHGATLDLAILDEAFAHVDARLEQSLKPAMSTKPAAQFWVVSTAGTPEDSPYLYGKVVAGRAAVEAGVTNGLAYFEWSAHDEEDPGDPATWWGCMPALGRKQTVDTIRADYESMVRDGNLNEFERAYLNRWKVALHNPVIPLSKWDALADEASSALNPVVFAFDVAPGGSSAAIAVAAPRSDGNIHLEVVDHQRGTDWLADRILKLDQRHKPAVIIADPRGPAVEVVPAVEKVLRREIYRASGADQAGGFGLLCSKVEQASIRHRGLFDTDLRVALNGADIRLMGDGAAAWKRRNAVVDISPLIAASLALWALDTVPAKPKVRVINLNNV